MMSEDNLFGVSGAARSLGRGLVAATRAGGALSASVCSGQS
jgi:hypothetical protein